MACTTSRASLCTIYARYMPHARLASLDGLLILLLAVCFIDFGPKLSSQLYIRGRYNTRLLRSRRGFVAHPLSPRGINRFLSSGQRYYNSTCSSAPADAAPASPNSGIHILCLCIQAKFWHVITYTNVPKSFAVAALKRGKRAIVPTNFSYTCCFKPRLRFSATRDSAVRDTIKTSLILSRSSPRAFSQLTRDHNGYLINPIAMPVERVAAAAAATAAWISGHPAAPVVYARQVSLTRFGTRVTTTFLCICLVLPRKAQCRCGSSGNVKLKEADNGV
ncbi:unnamed protein product [Trichogramma brassicae]|uniref:Uncharacterized protein n=1 Tax=Trichogramma brassicae TaxID=86971 RepID=A0A6H5ISU8_9HYME|nr:unnamed protein product [Trichogramma brassicae]